MVIFTVNKNHEEIALKRMVKEEAHKYQLFCDNVFTQYLSFVIKYCYVYIVFDAENFLKVVSLLISS